MLDNKKLMIRLGVVLTVLLAIAAIGITCFNKYSKYGIYVNVLNQDGYDVYELQKPVHFSAYIEPDWIPTKEDEVKELNKEIFRIGKVKIVIESVVNRGNDIYFNFDGIPYLKYNEGEFLSGSILNEDGTATDYNNANAFLVTNNDNIIVDIGQRGFGPEAKFSFAIDMDNYDLIADGFTMEYNSSIHYGYTLIK